MSVMDKIFRQRFIKTQFFLPIFLSLLLVLYLCFSSGLFCGVANKGKILGILADVVLLFFVIFKAIYSCCYIALGETWIVVANPYTSLYRKIEFSDISSIKISSGGIWSANFLCIIDKKGGFIKRPIALVGTKDLNLLVNLIQEQGINVEKFWIGSLK